MLRAENIQFRYKMGKSVLEDVSFEVKEGEVMCLLGPNGTGKTTSLRCLLGLLKPAKGKFLWKECDMSSLTAQKRAKLMAYVPQASALTFPYEVKEVVLMGRVAHLPPGSSPGQKDRICAWEALESLGIEHMANHVFQQLSGGEKQMVLIARALAQQSQLLILDEPTASLDFANQVRALQTVRDLSRRGYAVLMTSHSPDHAFLTSNNVVLMRDGRVYDSGDPERVITKENLSRLYGTQAEIYQTPVSSAGKNVKVCIPVIEE